MSDIQAQVIAYVQKVVHETGDKTKVSSQTALLGLGLLDSIGLVDLIAFLEARFGVEISDAAFGPELFETPASIARFIEESTSGG